MIKDVQKNAFNFNINKLYKKLIAGVVFTCMLLAALSGTFAYAENIALADIQNHWAFADIKRAVDNGYVKGYDDATFRPDAPVKRSEFITMLNAAFGVPVGGTASGFLDVHENEWFAQSIWSAVNAGYMDIYTDNILNPNLPIPRQEAAALTAGLAHIETTENVKEFIDAGAIADWASNRIDALVAAGIMDGYPDGSFRPDGKITRAEAVALINRALTYAGGKKINALLKVTGGTVNIRSGPDTSYGVLKKVYGGDLLTASLMSSNDWYRIDAGGMTGWITGSYVNIEGMIEADSAAPGNEGNNIGQDGASSSQNAVPGQGGSISRGGDAGRGTDSDTGTVTGGDGTGPAMQTGGTATDGSGSSNDNSENPVQSSPNGRLVVIDAGHGGYDEGAAGPDGVKEKDITLAIALKLSELLKNAGYDTLLTRSDDTYISLQNRSLAANVSKAGIFVSIHCNSSEYHTGYGTEVYTEPERLNPVYQQQDESRLLAAFVQNELIKTLGLTDRGIREKDLAVCRETNAPSILVETAFIDNKEEELLLSNPSFQDLAAAAVKQGIDSYFNDRLSN
ncbi:MAG TPA: N-acetylmuramoyl-L-alanine amidase [Clostridia bacterium]|nr:N-acetylmuramoyl-L-alanine amidase [Clostridia bacterium]